MKNKKINFRYQKIVLFSLGAWWTLAFIIAVLQIYFMSLKPVFLLLLLVLPPLAFYIHFILYKALTKNKKWAKLTLLVYGLAHFIPFLLQLLWIRQPGFDTIITLAIGLVLLEILD